MLGEGSTARSEPGPSPKGKAGENGQPGGLLRKRSQQETVGGKPLIVGLEKLTMGRVWTVTARARKGPFPTTLGPIPHWQHFVVS
jgi:hypothetical protein